MCSSDPESRNGRLIVACWTTSVIVAPAELEAVIAAHPGVADVGVIGIKSLDGTTELPK